MHFPNYLEEVSEVLLYKVSCGGHSLSSLLNISSAKFITENLSINILLVYIVISGSLSKAHSSHISIILSINHISNNVSGSMNILHTSLLRTKLRLFDKSSINLFLDTLFISLIRLYHLVYMMRIS